MIIAYLLGGIFLGLITFVAALLTGASIWLAFGLYAAVGAVGVLLFAFAAIAAETLGASARPANNEANTSELDESGDHADPTGQGEAPAMRILAVDDEPYILELIPLISANVGFPDVTAVASGPEALKLLNSGEITFDCLMFDISMPGMDGIELCQRAREIPKYSTTPVIMLTAMRDIQNMGDAYRAGASDYATKPFDIEELGARLQLASDAIDIQREVEAARREGRSHAARNARKPGFKLPDGLKQSALGNLVDHQVLLNYLTQLPASEVTDVEVLAICVNEIEAGEIEFSEQQLMTMLQDVAAAAAGLMGADKTLMAYTDSATLLVAVNAVDHLSAIGVENVIEAKLQDRALEYEASISVSVGGPIPPQGEKTKRAQTTANRVIAMAENRALDKNGRPVAGLFRR